MKKTIIMLLLFIPLNIFADELELRSIIRGDILELSNDTIIKVYGIKCPKKGQPYYEEAIHLVKKASGHGKIQIFPVETTWNGYTVAFVSFVGIDLSQALVRNGLAKVTNNCRIDECNIWRKLEHNARLQKKGIWNQ